MTTLIIILNAIFNLLTIAFCLRALRRPEFVQNPRKILRSERHYIYMYAARAIPLGILAAVVPIVWRSSAVAFILFTMALVQVLDSAIGFWQKSRVLSIVPLVGAVGFLLLGMYFLYNFQEGN
jgi:hypothetical protein